jgi:hypothetical protein
VRRWLAAAALLAVFVLLTCGGLGALAAHVRDMQNRNARAAVRDEILGSLANLQETLGPGQYGQAKRPLEIARGKAEQHEQHDLLLGVEKLKRHNEAGAEVESKLNQAGSELKALAYPVCMKTLHAAEKLGGSAEGGVSVLRALAISACARRWISPKHAMPGPRWFDCQ